MAELCLSRGQRWRGMEVAHDAHPAPHSLAPPGMLNDFPLRVCSGMNPGGCPPSWGGLDAA